MAKVIRMPKVGMLDGNIQLLEYIKKDGDSVKAGDVLFTIESDKIASEVESPMNGVVLKTFLEPGSSVPIGTLILAVGDPGEDLSEFEKEAVSFSRNKVDKPSDMSSAAPDTVSSSTASPALASAAEDSVKSSPAARKAAEQYGVSLAEVAGVLGLTRRVQREDVEAYIAERGRLDAGRQEVNAEPAEVRIPTIGQEAPLSIPVTHTRKMIAARMYESLRGMAQTSNFAELDVTELVEYRRALIEKEAKLGIKVTMTDLFAFAVIRMLRDHPFANAEWREKEIITYPWVNLSVAVATEYGLMSPVLKNADRMGLVELSKALHALVERARNNKLTSEDMTGGTFTITNMGIYPVDGFNPIINPPQSAIIGFGRTVEKPAVYRGQIAVRSMMTLSITYDHRVFDGAEAGSILTDMKQYLEHPGLIFA
jgi:pyruvate/2-oxoglutarate dehydrogenase complex dihydrolipoamide acyltransferase (E2) component